MKKNRIVLFYSNRADEALVGPLVPRLKKAGFRVRKFCFSGDKRFEDIPKSFDFGVIAADRWPMALLAPWLWNNGYPFAHIDAGEANIGGTRDDANRWAITRYADFIFTNSEKAKRRVVKSGEEPGRVFSVGYTAFDDIKLLSATQFFKKYGFPDEFDMVLFHPNPTSLSKTFDDCQKIICEIMDKPTIIMYPNSDLNSDAVLQQFAKIKPGEKELYFMEKFETRNDFLSALVYCQRLIGNSSCNTFEAKYLKVKNIVPVGDRNSTRKAEGVFKPGGSDKIVSILKQKFKYAPTVVKSVRL